MSRFETYSLQTVQEQGRETLERVDAAYGFVPNLMGTMIESPATAKAYLALGELFAETSFSPTEQQVISLAVSSANNCEYCVAAHSTVGRQVVPDDVIEALREDQPVADSRLEALRRFVAQAVEQRGWLEDAQVAAFLDAGFTKQQVFEVILGISMKTISNYINHIAETELDAAFAAEAWTRPEKAVA